MQLYQVELIIYDRQNYEKIKKFPLSCLPSNPKLRAIAHNWVFVCDAAIFLAFTPLQTQQFTSEKQLILLAENQQTAAQFDPIARCGASPIP